MVAVAKPKLTAEQLTLRPGDAVMYTSCDQTEHVGTVAIGPLPGHYKSGKAGWMILLLGQDDFRSLNYVRPIGRSSLLPLSSSPPLATDQSPLATRHCGAVGSGPFIKAPFDRCRRLLKKWRVATGEWRVVSFVGFVVSWLCLRVRRRVAGKRISSPACPSRPPATLL